MKEYYLAVDMGASSGRHLMGWLEDGKMINEEIHRFDNGLTKKDGQLCWDLQNVFEEVKVGMKKCKEAGKVPVCMGIDTWGVDFVLLDENDQVLGNTVGYRDSRTNGMDEKVYEVIPEKDLYARTGIQKQIFNTIYQLEAIKQTQPEILEKACTMLMVPDYLHFLLTGVKKTEYTNATTGQLINPWTKDWDWELIDMLGFPRKIFCPIIKPGTSIGGLRPEIAEEVGFNCDVVVPGTHDTASAVLAVPSDDENTLYISSGTWSLLGIERLEPDCSPESQALNFTNEGGYDYRFRYLKNIMGLWMIQSVRNELGRANSFAEMCAMADEAKIDSIVDCQDQVFLAPDSMIDAIKDYCRNTNQQVPETVGEISRVVYKSLADCYAKAIKALEEANNVTYTTLNIVGGGSNAEYLNLVTAEATGKRICAGPGEATAIGNLAAQMINHGALKDLWDARKCVFNSFEIKTYEP